jgi:hypothetical protein
MKEIFVVGILGERRWLASRNVELWYKEEMWMIRHRWIVWTKGKNAKIRTKLAEWWIEFFEKRIVFKMSTPPWLMFS